MYVGPAIDDFEILRLLPSGYRDLLETANGYVAYHGGLHVRGACVLPEWHSLRAAWVGEDAIHRLFSEVSADDIPFAEDALGDQFVIREDLVWRLSSESGDIVSLGLTLAEFDAAVRADPDEFLQLGPLHQFRSEGGHLEPGQLLAAYPPFVFKESAGGVRLSAIPAHELRRYLSHLARSIRDVPAGGRVRFRVEP